MLNNRKNGAFSNVSLCALFDERHDDLNVAFSLSQQTGGSDDMNSEGDVDSHESGDSGGHQQKRLSSS
ncbi:MAG: hypothetical protein CL866_05875 [Cycloclasticus sp.]|nr:hypothetical protein [Cycloclasticus sp.]MBG96386.1 hypothetical protein [Cycloclasticus sp.]HAI96597.1 hypothetical protein [Methylococcaceae bacterium]|tara:strand:- start:3896 stop:4099 length:204 start_codon:yes stop_codon:yes gene_type:complete